MRRLLRSAAVVLAAALGVGLSGAASAQPVGQSLAITDFFRLPQFRAPRLNPAGTHVAFIRELKGRYNLFVMDLASKEIKNVAAYDAADVESFQWINAERLLYRVQDLRGGDGNESLGVFAIDRDGSRPYTLSEGLVSRGGVVGSGSRGLPARGDFYARARSGDSSEFIVGQFATNPDRVTLMRVNSRDGSRKAIDIGGLTNVLEWVLDHNDVPRAALAYDKGTRVLYVRDSATSAWRKVSEVKQDSPEVVRPILFDKAGVLYLAARLPGRDHTAIHRFDWAKGEPEAEPLVSVRGYDLDVGSGNQDGRVADRLIFDADGVTLVGVRYEAEHHGTHWIKPEWSALQEVVDNALKGRINLLAGSLGGTVLVTSFSDASPERFYLFDTKVKRLQLLGTSRPWIDERTQAQSDVIRYAARDGLSIPALLTLPKGVEPKGLPLVVLVHGGPYVRGVPFGWQRERQFLAARGYAVLEPEYRGSTGFGWNHFRSGWKQWGLAMQDDLADGVEALAKRGIVDPTRVCIAGASYGGYATVMGLIRHPQAYKCGISWVGVTDIELMYTVGWSDTADSEWARYGMPVLVGDREKDAQQLRETSAIVQASRLRAPLLLAYGVKDVRVPYDHGQKLRDAVRPHNKDVEYLEYPGEGHGWRQLETNVDFWTRAERLLSRSIGTTK